MIKCGFVADECWPSTLKKLGDLCKLFRWGDFRDVCSSYLSFNGKSTEVLKTFTASLAQWRFETLCVVFEKLCKLRAFMHNDFCLDMFATSKDKAYHIEAVARDQHLWRYATWAQRFASMVDKYGRQGAQCRCHEAERRAGTSVVCDKLSRRLHEAPGANDVFLTRVESHER